MINEKILSSITDASNDRIRMYEIIKIRCYDHEDIVRFCDFQIEMLKLFIGIKE